MARRRLLVANNHLPDLPDDRTVLLAVAQVQGYRRSRDYYRATANRVAWRLGIEGARRMGRGAVAHSWTGTMSASLRISPRLIALSKRGLLTWMYDETPGSHRRVYLLTKAGREEIRMEGTRTDIEEADSGDEAIWVSTDFAGEPENLGPVKAGDVTWVPGETVRLPDDHDVYPDEEAVVKVVGMGTGLYQGSVVYDVLVDGTEEPHRITESDLEAA